MNYEKEAQKLFAYFHEVLTRMDTLQEQEAPAMTLRLQEILVRLQALHDEDLHTINQLEDKRENLTHTTRSRQRRLEST